MEKPKHYMLIACAVLHRECYYCAAISKNIIDIKLCEKGLHDIGATKMSARLQAEIDSVEANNYDAILLAYGLCNNGTMGLHSKIPIVLPRAHDCITLLMGSKEKYQQYFNQNTGTFYRSSGWIERDTTSDCIEHGTSYINNPESTVSQMGISSYQEYVKKYGEENAKYLMETLGMMSHYNKLAYIDTPGGDFQNYKDNVKKNAIEKGWKYEEIEGNIDLLLRLLNGQWDDNDFLIIPSGYTSEPSYDESIIKSKSNKKMSNNVNEPDLK
jgi:hypothetical protein